MVRRSLRRSSASTTNSIPKATEAARDGYDALSSGRGRPTSLKKRAVSFNDTGSSKARKSKIGQHLSYKQKSFSSGNKAQLNEKSAGDLTDTSASFSEDVEDDEKVNDDNEDESSYEERHDPLDNPTSSSESSQNSIYTSGSDVSRKRKRSKGRGTTKASKARTKPNREKGTSTELWRPGTKTGYGPGTEVVIKRPQPRDDGGMAYTDTTIHPNTMLFLGDLKANNDREWLKMHDPDYRIALKDYQSFVERLSEKLCETDDTIPELPLKDIIFRIYRDVRFSPDPTPYKPYFSAAWSRTGRKGPYAAYYMQIQPGDSFVGGGLWMPEAASLASIRDEIDREPLNFKNVLTEPNLSRMFFPHARKQSEVVSAFVKGSSDNALKTKPKGYSADHPEISLLRLRSFIIGKKVDDEEICRPDGIDRIVEIFDAMVPFITYLNSIVMPDEEG